MLLPPPLTTSLLLWASLSQRVHCQANDNPWDTGLRGPADGRSPFQRAPLPQNGPSNSPWQRSPLPNFNSLPSQKFPTQNGPAQNGFAQNGFNSLPSQNFPTQNGPSQNVPAQNGPGAAPNFAPLRSFPSQKFQPQAWPGAAPNFGQQKRPPPLDTIPSSSEDDGSQNGPSQDSPFINTPSQDGTVRGGRQRGSSSQNSSPQPNTPSPGTARSNSNPFHGDDLLPLESLPNGDLGGSIGADTSPRTGGSRGSTPDRSSGRFPSPQSGSSRGNFNQEDEIQPAPLPRPQTGGSRGGFGDQSGNGEEDIQPAPLPLSRPATNIQPGSPGTRPIAALPNGNLENDVPTRQGATEEPAVEASGLSTQSYHSAVNDEDMTWTEYVFRKSTPHHSLNPTNKSPKPPKKKKPS